MKRGLPGWRAAPNTTQPSRLGVAALVSFTSTGLPYRRLVLVCNKNVMKPLRTYTHCFEDLEKYVEVSWHLILLQLTRVDVLCPKPPSSWIFLKMNDPNEISFPTFGPKFSPSYSVQIDHVDWGGRRDSPLGTKCDPYSSHFIQTE